MYMYDARKTQADSKLILMYRSNTCIDNTIIRMFMFTWPNPRHTDTIGKGKQNSHDNNNAATICFKPVGNVVNAKNGNLA